MPALSNAPRKILASNSARYLVRNYAKINDIEIEVHTHEIDEMEREMREKIVRKGRTPFMHQMFRRLQEEQKDIFDTRDWAPLSKRYGKWKKKYFPNRPIMYLYGDLRKSLTLNSPAALKYGGIRDVKVGKFGASLPYVNTHMFGIPTRNIPARPFFVDADKAGQEAAKLWARYIDSGYDVMVFKRGSVTGKFGE